MKFDSTAYLTFSLKEKLKFDDKITDYCIRILSGFVIQPGSIKYDTDNKLLTLMATLPNNELEVSKVIISYFGINMKFHVKGKAITINLNCEVYSQRLQLSILINSIISDEKNSNGIYYYDSTAFNTTQCDWQGLLSYYDAETLKVIEDVYLIDFIHNNLTLNDIIGYKSDKINEFGFVPDDVEWSVSKINKNSCSSDEFANIINNKIMTFNYEEFMDSISKFSKRSSTDLGPVRKR